MKKIILSIDGMTCSACSNGLEKYLNKQEGIIVAGVNLVMANATIEYDEKHKEKPYLVCLKEDTTKPKWLFECLSDLIVIK